MEIRPIKIFAAGSSPRLRYIADLILHEILGLHWEIVTDRRKIGKYPVINYSQEEIKGSCKINPASLLFETGLRKQEIEITDWNGLPVFFQCSSDSDMPFDIFAASFYMVTRYEEYLGHKPDEFGRFKASDSLAYKNGFLDLPVVDLWTRELAKALIRKYHTLAFKRNVYKALVTIDIDEPFAFRGKSLIGDISGFFLDITANKGQALHRFECLTKGKKDPYEVFDYMNGCIEKNNSESRFFFPFGDHSEHDRNPSWKNDDYRDLISASNKSDIGILTSFKASVESLALMKEINRLQAITGEKVSRNRFHILRIIMPVSYVNISGSGISEDYSMGFSDEPGFRAGIARPFLFYNVSEDVLTPLRIIPFQVMDKTLTGNKKSDSISAKETISKIIMAVKNAGGLFVSIWHNKTLLDTPECFEWREVFEFTLKEQGL